MSSYGVLKRNRVSFAICLFLILFGIMHMTKPGFIYNKEGGFRPFGIGYRHKTVISVWVAAIVLAVFCYAFVTYI